MKSKIPRPLQHFVCIVLLILGLLAVFYFGKDLGRIIGDQMLSK